MTQEKFKDKGITLMIYILKSVGLWLENDRELKRSRRIALSCTLVALIYGIYVNVVDLSHKWGNVSHCIFLICNTMCITLALFKFAVIYAYKTEVGIIIDYAYQFFWHSNYDSSEQSIFSTCQIQCKYVMIIMYCAVPSSTAGYIITPILENIGQNKSDWVLPFTMWVNWPLNESPYYELMFTFQVICVHLIVIAYIAPECFVCVMNLHTVCQFRILQYKLLKFWKATDQEAIVTQYGEFYYECLKDCIQYHQRLILYSKRLKRTFSLTTLGHFVVFSLLMGLDCYELLLTDTVVTRRVINTARLIGSFIHLIVLTNTCNGLVEESCNITTAAYFGLWNILPMGKTGKSMRKDVCIIMARSMRPCCITAGGFFPVTLETATALMSSTLSYFTLLRESSLRSEDE